MGLAENHLSSSPSLSSFFSLRFLKTILTWLLHLGHVTSDTQESEPLQS